MKKIYIVSFIILLLGSTLFLSSEQKKNEKLIVNLEAVTGHNLYLLITSYKTIYEESTKEQLTIAQIKNIKKNLASIEVYSKTIDLSVGHQILLPIAINFNRIVSYLEENYPSINGGFSEEDLSTYQELTLMIKELEINIYEHYYDKNDHYGGKPDLEMRNLEPLTHFTQQLSDYLSEKNIP